MRPELDNKCLLKACYLPGTVGRADDTAGNKRQSALSLGSLNGERGEWTEKKINVKSGSSLRYKEK